ncbi:MAG: DUF6752 domain-containing protein [Sciscionella sp.]
MATLSEQVRTNIRKLALRVTGLGTEVSRLRERVAQLEREAEEARRLNQRVAELADVVAEVLVPAADRDDDKLRKALNTYSETSF